MSDEKICRAVALALRFPMALAARVRTARDLRSECRVLAECEPLPGFGEHGSVDAPPCGHVSRAQRRHDGVLKVTGGAHDVGAEVNERVAGRSREKSESVLQPSPKFS